MKKYHKIVIAGGSGFLGNLLADYFSKTTEEIVILTRRPEPSRGNIRYVQWDARTTGAWCKELNRADVLLNMTGKNVNCRYTEKNKKLIYQSRLESTRVLDEVVRMCSQPPGLWINSGSATIYIASYDRMMTEKEGIIGDDFSMDVCKQWEKTFFETSTPATRKVVMRIGIVLGKSGGAFVPLRNLVRFGLGGKQGKGDQFCSWIHEKDFCKATEFIMEHHNPDSVYNVTGPKPVTNQQFMAAMRHGLQVPVGLPSPSWLLEAGAVVIGTETELIFKSRKVYPERLLQQGFVFEFADIEEAMDDLCA